MRDIFFFALDNIDFSEDIVDGKNTLLGTVLIAFQQQTGCAIRVQERLELEKPSREKSLSHVPSTIVDLMPCHINRNPKPKESKQYPEYRQSQDVEIPKSEKTDVAWLFCRSLERINPVEGAKPWVEENHSFDKEEMQAATLRTDSDDSVKVYLKYDDCDGYVPPWAAFNSMLDKRNSQNTSIHVIPLIASPAHEWQTLMTVLKHAQHINAEVVGPERKTNVTLDMDLYARALKLQTLMPEFKNSLVLRIGEFHTVLCALRALGGIIENSGIDNSWEESNLYSPATVRQILEGKHLKRALNAHAMTAEVLFDLLVKERSIAEVTAKCAEPLKSMQKSVICYGYDKVAKAKQTVVRAMEEEQFQENLLHLCNDLKAQSPISSFLLDYMAIFQNILSFIRASREGNWLLHLATLEQLCPLFFSQNRLKYAQHVPEYLEKMYHLQETAPEIWAEFYKGSFCVSKSEVGFTSIGVDHALEQKNRKLKVLWGS